MCNFGVSYASFDEFQVISGFFEKIRMSHAALFKYNAIKKSLLHPVFSRTKEYNYLAIEVDIFDDDQVDMCNYLSVALVCFYIDKRKNIVEIASQTLKQVCKYNQMKFAVLTDNYQEWVEFSCLCGNPPNMFVFPYLSNNSAELSLWNSTHLFSVMVKDKNYNQDGSLMNDLGLFLYVLLERSIPVFIPSKCENLTFVNMFSPIYNIIQNVNIDPFSDSLRVPLETINNDLTSAVYETFEEDKVKYEKYQAAIEKAIKAKSNQKDLIIAVAGAGRGPLVDCALRVGAVNNYVIEKNKNAFQYIKLNKEMESPDTIQLFYGRIEEVELPKKVDILITELLGGFGDNELSPECLANCERFLNEGAISIPQEYTSYIVPIMSQHLWTKAIYEKRQQNMLAIQIKSSIFLSQPSPLMKFNHPGKNELYKSSIINFQSLINGYCHGFGGWFEAKLFDDVMISSSPINGTPGMFSWWTIYFPLETPIPVNEGKDIKIMFSRKCDDEQKHVWYEWSLIEPTITPIHNAGGNVFVFTYK